MQKKNLFIGFALIVFIHFHVVAQDAKTDSTYKKWFVGSSLLMLGKF
jgi:hypothetical protein